MTNAGNTCRSDGCDHAARKTGFCEACYMRLRRNGGVDLKQRLVGGSLWGRLWNRTVVKGDCWLYDGATDRKGYQRIQIGKRSLTAHRAAFREFIQSDIKGLHLHHTCGEKACWRPDHLVPMLPSEHLLMHWETRH